MLKGFDGVKGAINRLQNRQAALEHLHMPLAE